RVSEMAGIDPDETRLRGSHWSGPPPVPRSHLWYRRSGLTEHRGIDDHLDVIFGIIGGHADGLRRVASTEDTAVWLKVVRYFAEGAAELDESSYELPADSGLEHLSDPHPILGWGLDPGHLQLLAETGIRFDVDEYGS